MCALSASIAAFNRYHESGQNNDAGFGTFMIGVTGVAGSRLIVRQYPRLANTLAQIGGFVSVASLFIWPPGQNSNSGEIISESQNFKI